MNIAILLSQGPVYTENPNFEVKSDETVWDVAEDNGDEAEEPTKEEVWCEDSSLYNECSWRHAA